MSLGKKSLKISQSVIRRHKAKNDRQCNVQKRSKRQTM